MGKRNADTNLHNANPHKKCKLDETLNDSDAAGSAEFVLTKELVVGTVLTDINQKQWRVGKPIGKCLNSFIARFSNYIVIWLKVKAVLARYF